VLRLAIAVLIQKNGRSARPVGALAGGDCDLVGALGCGIGEGGKAAQAVRVDVGAMAMWASRNAATCSALKLATTFITTYPMAPSACRSQAAITRVLPAVSAALVALAAEIDVIGFDRRAGAAVRRRGAQHGPRTALGHGVAQALMQIPRGR